MHMAEKVIDFKARQLEQREQTTLQTVNAFNRMREESELQVFSNHFQEQRKLRFEGINNRQFHRVVAEGEISKVSPGKYNHWKVEVWKKVAGEVISVACEVRDDCLRLITCWEGKGDEPES